MASPFVDEGYRKVWARRRAKNVRTSKDRVRRVMREHGLSAPHLAVRRRGNNDHDGTIPTRRPDEMWGTDATSALTGEGAATIFFAVDHYTSECVGIHAARHGTRIEALEPIRQGVRACFGRYDRDAAVGLALRHDHGSQFLSDHFQHELVFLGVRASARLVAEPECNGVAERFVRTLKHQLLSLKTFDTIEGLRRALQAFKHLYNHEWLVQKHRHLTPAAVRARFSNPAQAAA